MNPSLRKLEIEEVAGPVSISDRAREVASSPYWLRIAALSGLLALCAGFVVRFTDPTRVWQNGLAHTLVELFGVLITGGIMYCLWVEYSVSLQRRTLISLTAFGGLLVGQLAHGLSTLALLTGADSTLTIVFDYYYHGWQVIAAGFLIYAAGKTDRDGGALPRRKAISALVSPILFSVLLTVFAYQVCRAWPRVGDQILALPISIPESMEGWLSFHSALHALSVLAFAWAFIAFSRQYMLQEDTLSENMAVTVLILMSSQGLSAWAGDTAGLAWWAAHAFLLTGLLIFLIRLGMEFGASYVDAHERVEHLGAVYYISSRLNSTLDLRVVLLTLVSDTASMLSAQFASIMLADDAGENLTTVVTHGLPDEVIGLRQSQSLTGSGRPGFYSGHTAKAFSEKRICVVDDIYTDVEFIPWKLLAKYDGYTVSVPLVYHEIPIGVLNLFFDQRVPLNEERIRLFETLAVTAAVAIANAQLYDRNLQSQQPARLAS